MSMMTLRKKLPIGIQTFRDIREGGYYYVDKSSFACRLVEDAKYYFLSRPRRFGKSLLIDTLKELFEGNQDLFTGLYAGENWDWSERYPVLRISFGEAITSSREALNARIEDQLRRNAERLEVDTVISSDHAASLSQLVRDAARRHGQRVVILIDEYDKPILDYIDRPEVALEMREGLRILYSAIKDLDANLKFVLLTGVSKFSKVNLFSQLNNLKDITLDKRYSALCGYTEADLDDVFAPEVADIDREEFRRWYNGYNWTGEAVYNPFDALLFFDSHEFRPYWYETGTPTFLVKLLSSRQTFLPNLARLYAGTELLGRFDVDFIASEALLFQAGYLTLGETLTIDNEPLYRLRYPNREVEVSLNKSLLWEWTGPETDTTTPRLRLWERLQAQDHDGLRELLTGFFASIPHQWYTNNPIAQYEGYYASVFYAFFASLGLDVRVEESSNAGRLDMAVLMDKRALIFEFKLVEDQAEGKALAQILEKGYDQPHRAAGREVHCIGIEFSKAKRNIVGWEHG
jgi:hypothetical protein